MAVSETNIDLTNESMVDEEAAETDKKKKTSKVWLGFVVNADGNSATCQKCKKVLKLNKSTTSNLLNHLTSKTHLTWFNSLNGTSGESRVAGSSQQTQSTLAETYAKAFEQKRFEELLIKYVVSQDESFLLIDSPEFKDMITYLNPKAVLFSRVALKSKVCMIKYHYLTFPNFSSS